MKCRDFQEFIDSYLSDELLTETNHGILRHLEECANCRGEIEARREIRGRLKTAVVNSPQYQIAPEFASNLSSLLKRMPITKAKEKSAGLLTKNSWVAVAASLVLVFTLGFVLLNQFGKTNIDIASETSSVGSLQRNDIVNVALGDHDHCAIRHQLEESPVSLEKASAKYRGLDRVIVPSLNRVLAKYELVEAHACKYLDARFAHIVLTDDEKTLSVLVTDLEDSDKLRGDEIANFVSSDSKYQIAGLKTNTHSMFVISNLDRQKNSQVLEALSGPLRKHFSDREQFQTALLTFY